MNEEEVKALLGDDYKEGITASEVEEIMKKKYTVDNSADLTAKDNLIKAKEKELAELKKKIKENSSAEDRTALDLEEKERQIKELQEQIAQGNIDKSKASVTGKLEKAKELCDLNDKDIKEITTIVDNICTEDVTKDTATADAIMSLIKKAYEKGKNEKVKENLGKMGKVQMDGEDGSDGNQSIAKRLAKQEIEAQKKYDSLYFNHK